MAMTKREKLIEQFKLWKQFGYYWFRDGREVKGPYSTPEDAAHAKSKEKWKKAA